MGLPLAVEFGKQRPVTGFDTNTARIQELRNGFDRTREVDEAGLKAALHLKYSAAVDDLRHAQIYIITVPTPVDIHNNPDLTPLRKATETVAGVLKRGDIVIYESTVYPGVTEEICVPVLEAGSGLRFNKDFYCGYSPERINPGDRERTLTNIRKITSASTPEIAAEVDRLYASIIRAGTYRASSIKVAEAAKVIENAQRDINIAFMNELAKIFNLLQIDTHEVLEAAGTKWNFLDFKPGLVGGHCIGVDPFYIAHRAKEAGYTPEIILAGRRINDSMGAYVAQQFVKILIGEGYELKGAAVLVLGITFKENFPDIRNSRVIDMIRELESFGLRVTVYDPVADKEETLRAYGIDMSEQMPSLDDFSGTILAVGHQAFLSLDTTGHIVYDVKGLLDKNKTAGRL